MCVCACVSVQLSLPLEFHPVVWKLLVGHRLDLDDLKSIDRDTASMLEVPPSAQVMCRHPSSIVLVGMSVFRHIACRAVRHTAVLLLTKLRTCMWKTARVCWYE